VAIDTTPLLGARTGVGTFVRGAATALTERSEVSLVGYGLSRRRRPPDVSGVDAGRMFPAGVALRAWTSGVAWPNAPWLARGPVDLVHGTNFVVPPGAGAARVVTVHDLTAVTFPELCTPTSLRYPALIRRAVAEGAWVHTPSAFVAAQVCSLLGVSADRVRPVAHGVDAGRGDPLAGRRLAGADRYVLSLGTVEPRKDLPLLVRAWDGLASTHPDVHLVIAGPDGWGTEALAAAVSSADNADRVVRIGWVDSEARTGLLAGAAAFAFPSVYEGFGLPPLEAMAAGVPVVACAAGAVPEVVGDAAIVVPVGDEEALAEALVAVLDGPDVAAGLVAAGHRRAAEFTWARCAEGLISLYREASA
jgi:glycosyltransferase involved in cell wall biosynthesis